MPTQDFNHRIALVVCSELPLWKALNTTAHLSAFFGNYLNNRFGTAPNFETADGIRLPRNTQYPIIILQATPAQIHEFSRKMHQNNQEVTKMYFIKEMIESTNDERIEALVSLQLQKELEYLGVGLFGENQLIKDLTSNFKLWS